MKQFIVLLVLASVLSWMILPVASFKIYYPMPGYCKQPPPKSEGLCTIDIEGFYYDERTNDCERYEVSGCRSTPGQSFGSREDCIATCVYRTRHIKDLYVFK